MKDNPFFQKNNDEGNIFKAYSSDSVNSEILETTTI